MRSDIEIEIPSSPDEIEGVNEEYIVVYPIQRSGTFVEAGDILFSLDIGPAILEVEAPYKGTYTSTEIVAGGIVKPGQVVANIDLTTVKPEQGLINTSSVLGFLLGAVTATIAMYFLRNV